MYDYYLTTNSECCGNTFVGAGCCVGEENCGLWHDGHDLSFIWFIRCCDVLSVKEGDDGRLWVSEM